LFDANSVAAISRPFSGIAMNTIQSGTIKTYWHVGILIALFVLALGIRLYYVNDSSLIAERQFRSALLARAYYYETQDSIPEWQREIARINVEREDSFEPPILEHIAALVYRILGRESIAVARIFSVIFWMVGGVFFYLVAHRLFPLEVAVVGTAYYLLRPIGIHSSISFIPDPLMIMWFLICLWAMLRYFDQPSSNGVVLAGVFAGLSVLAKPMGLFAILAAFLGLTLYKKGMGRQTIDRHFLIFVSIALLPFIVYYAYGVLLAGFLTRQAEISFLPHLFLERTYWRDWLFTAIDAVGYMPLIAALLGLAVLPWGRTKALLLGLWFGYLVLGLVFNNHIQFATHYHLQLIIIVALSFSPLVTTILQQFRLVLDKWYGWIPVIIALAIVLTFNFRAIRADYAFPRFESVEVAEEIGELVGHSSQTVYLAPYYGRPLHYYGQLSGVYWPRANDYWTLQRAGMEVSKLSVQERFEMIDYAPEYFIITDFQEFNRHHDDLRIFLTENCSLMAKSNHYLIYEMDCLH
jgi:4-amino-4-deoxy-L-arabinose transferase-like glycosyltransferase